MHDINKQGLIIVNRVIYV